MSNMMIRNQSYLNHAINDASVHQLNTSVDKSDRRIAHANKYTHQEKILSFRRVVISHCLYACQAIHHQMTTMRISFRRLASVTSGPEKPILNSRKVKNTKCARSHHARNKMHLWIRDGSVLRFIGTIDK
jgi:hypothetical protein